jgi:hypothetical protein
MGARHYDRQADRLLVAKQLGPRLRNQLLSSMDSSSSVDDDYRTIDYWRFWFIVEFQLNELWVKNCCGFDTGIVRQPRGEGNVPSWKPLPEDWQRDTRPRRVSPSCSEPWSVWIGDSAIVNLIKSWTCLMQPVSNQHPSSIGTYYHIREDIIIFDTIFLSSILSAWGNNWANFFS